MGLEDDRNVAESGREKWREGERLREKKRKGGFIKGMGGESQWMFRQLKEL